MPLDLSMFGDATTAPPPAKNLDLSMFGSVADRARQSLALRNLTPEDVKAGKGLTTPEQIQFNEPTTVNGGYIGGLVRSIKPDLVEIASNAVAPIIGPQMVRAVRAVRAVAPLVEHHAPADIASAALKVGGLPDYPAIASESYHRGEANQSRSDMYGEATLPVVAAAAGLAAKVLPKGAPMAAEPVPEPPSLIERPRGSTAEPLLYTASGDPLIDAPKLAAPAPTPTSATSYLWRKFARLIPGVDKAITAAEIGKAVYESPLFRTTTPTTKGAFANALKTNAIPAALALGSKIVGGEGLADEYGHDTAVHAAVDDAFAKADGNPMIARQLLHAQEAVYVNPDGSEVRIPGHVFNSFVNAIPNTNLQHTNSGVDASNAQSGQAQSGRAANLPRQGPELKQTNPGLDYETPDAPGR